MGNLFYFLVSGNGDGNNSLFELSSTGILRSNQIFDHESYPNLFLRVGVMDDQNQITAKAFEVQVLDGNETAPNLPPSGLESSTELRIEEEQPIGSLVGEFNASDPESDQLTYYLAAGEGDTDNLMFTVSADGILRTGEILRHDGNQTFLSIRVGARDELAGSIEAIFSVVVLEIEDNQTTEPFYFDATSLQVFENSPVGSPIGNFYATSGVNPGAKVEYLLNDKTELFEIEENGTLKTRVVFDFEDLNQTELPIEVLARSELNQIALRSFTVEIMDANDSDNLDGNEFDFNATNLVILENAQVGTRVGRFFAVGEWTNSVVHFSLTDSNSLFEIDDFGYLRTRVNLDYDRFQYYNLRTEVTARNESNQTKVRVFDVIMLDVNYEPDEIYLEGGTVVNEGAGQNQFVGNLKVRDEDEYDVHELQLVHGQGSEANEFFRIEDNGTLRFISSGNLDGGQDLNIRVRATDPGGAFIENTFTVRYEMDNGDSVILLTEGADIGGGWKRAGWFGYYFGMFHPWIHHENLGWIFVEQRGESDVWLFREGLGWAWTSAEFFPFLYLIDRREWTYLDRTAFPARMFDYTYMEWFNLDLPYEISVMVEPQVGGTIRGQGSYFRWEMVTLQAVADPGFEFAGWTGEFEGMGATLEFEVHRNINLKASFVPILDPSGGSSGSIRSINDYVESLDHLTPQEKKDAMAKILIFGRF